jgi:hypothetical protein
MKLKNAITKLKKNNFSVKQAYGSYVATLGESVITFFSQNDNVKNFTFEDANACAPTYGLNLKQAISFCK